MKSIMVVLMVAVLVALAGAGVFMLRKGNDDNTRRRKDMARALALRVALSVTLFLVILLSWAMGWIQPSGLPVG
jgi:cytochrome bd-type quinol oxidase subunit 2